MTQERREQLDRRANDRRQLNRRGEGGWRLSADGRRSEERRGEGRRA
ncbi:MAG: hypothetical protein ACI82A_003926 [Candidatus Azotimanducaceae bacterium]|jgi:hypothetical protein